MGRNVHTDDYGVSDSTIHNWRRQLAEHGSDAFPGSGHQMPIEEENRRLKRELEIVRTKTGQLQPFFPQNTTWWPLSL